MVAEDDTITLDVSPSVSQPDFALTEAITEATGESADDDLLRVALARDDDPAARRPELPDRRLPAVLGLREIRSSRPACTGCRVWGGWRRAARRRHSDTDFVIVVSPSIVRERSPRAELWAFPDATALLGARRRGDGDDVKTAAAPRNLSGSAGGYK